ncbi:MAG: hypothetical protein CFE37_13735 [Alphaproteobacteria bacterium PA4]|nr:MAG: hypothetical protein CFE37_13735 [Alphaproteobacteria bacterium PA4]
MTGFRRRWLALPLLAVAAFGTVAATRAPAPVAAPRLPGTLPRFPDFGLLPAPEAFVPDRTFRLSQDYPKVLPPLEPALQRLLAIDYTRDWKAYAEATLAYVLAGNIENRDLQGTFFVEDNKVRPWYHVPWMHWADNGREGLHGLTPEGPIRVGSLGPQQKNIWQTYAVGFYNARGGHAIGRVWTDANRPDINALQRQGFPVGTVVAKILFTDAPVSEAPFLSNPIEWSAYIKKQFSFTPTGFPIAPRAVAPVRLIQIDIMVRDSRADATGGWVFGTFVYNGLQAKPRTPGQSFDNRWRNLMPVGLMWGQDPKVTSQLAGNPVPVKTLVNPDLKETVINSDPRLPPMHLGFGLRLNGPADNAISSCKSCHSVAEFPDISPVVPYAGSFDTRNLVCGGPEWMRWFRNEPVGQAFDAGARNFDNSLSLAMSVINFLDARSRADGGSNAVQYWQGRRQMTHGNQRGGGPDNSPCPPATGAIAAR